MTIFLFSGPHPAALLGFWQCALKSHLAGSPGDHIGCRVSNPGPTPYPCAITPTPQLLYFFVIFGVSPSDAQGLLIILHSGIMPGCFPVTLWDAGDWPRVQAPYPLNYCLGPKGPIYFEKHLFPPHPFLLWCWFGESYQSNHQITLNAVSSMYCTAFPSSAQGLIGLKFSVQLCEPGNSVLSPALQCWLGAVVLWGPLRRLNSGPWECQACAAACSTISAVPWHFFFFQLLGGRSHHQCSGFTPDFALRHSWLPQGTMWNTGIKPRLALCSANVLYHSGLIFIFIENGIYLL